MAENIGEDDPSLLNQLITEDVVGVDINDYLHEAISSNLKKLDFKWKSECLLCAIGFEEYQDLFLHCKTLHKNELGEYACTLQDCDVVLKNEDILARHLVLKHADLESIKIYCVCPYCDLRSSSFSQLNKHSCYRKLTRKACIQPYCQYCKEEFVSHKRFVFHLQFHLAKRRPKICLVCNADFNDVDEFFIHVNYAHEPPETMACSICDRIFIEKDAYNAHQDMHKSKPKYKCNECNKSYYAKRFLAQHKENIHDNAEYKCDICAKELPTYTMLQTHMKWHDTDAEVQAYICTNCGLIGRDNESLKTHISKQNTECFEIEETILVSAFRCLFCSLDYKDKDSMRKHRASGIHEDGKFHCPLCYDEFENYKAKRTHLATHKNYKPWLESLPLKRRFMCDEGNCDECYAEWPAFFRHKKRIHKSTICQKCNQKFSNADELQNHAKQCGLSGLKCQFCDKMCPTKMSLAIHVTKRHNNKNLPCPHCSCVLKDQKALEKHVGDAHLPATCEQCDKVFRSKRYLASHIRAIHEHECRYFCSYCEKGYFFRSQRDSHVELMHPKSLYKCGKCKYETKYAKSLEIHMDKHLNNEKMLCPYCSKKFGRMNSLNLHIKRHENNKPYRCCDTIVDGCEAAYIAEYLLNNHIKSKHANKWNEIQKNNIAKTKKNGAVAKEKYIRPSRRKNKTTTSTSTARKCNEGQNETVNNMLNAAVDEITATPNLYAIETSNEEQLTCVVDDNSISADKNYMLVLMDDISMQMVNNADQLFLLEDVGDTELNTILNVT
ncbi:zinc finger protein 665 isoform X2 [Eurosta solidaginis]|uniref:zinc finger protein 665 isoform X2 n=1 Tax=Eurosta solidaginis TaxID=178769 RepID=UPI003531259B